MLSWPHFFQVAFTYLHFPSPHWHVHLLLPSSLQPQLFLQGDPALVEAFEGLNPQQEKHQFQIDILPVTKPKYFSLSSVLKQLSLLRKWVLGCEQLSGPRSTLLWRGSLSQSAKLTSVTRNWICSLPWFLRQGPIYSNFWHMGGTYMVFTLITTTGWPECKFQNQICNEIYCINPLNNPYSSWPGWTQWNN